MKMATVRKMDTLNRVVLPADMRSALGMEPKCRVTLEQTEGGVIAIGTGDNGSGLTRTVDELGRVALPAELREALNLNQEAEVRMTCDGRRILLQASVPVCRLCGSEIKGRSLAFGGYAVCEDCVKAIQSAKI